MQIVAKAVVLLACAATVRAADSEWRFRLIHTPTPSGRQEILTSLRTVGGFDNNSMAIETGTLIVKGPADRLALAEWLVPRLDAEADGPTGAQEFHLARDADDLVMFYRLANTESPTGMQEIVTSLRTVADIAKIYSRSAPKLILSRGTVDQIARAKFLISELDRTPLPRQEAFVHEFPDERETHERWIVYGLVNAGNSPVKMQEIITALRSVLEINKIYNASGPNLLAMRASQPMLQTAKWLVSGLDTQIPTIQNNEARIPGGNDDVVHVFYPAHITSMKTIQRLVATLRMDAGIQRMYISSQPPGLIVRGTADRIALAGKLIALQDVPGN